MTFILKYTKRMKPSKKGIVFEKVIYETTPEHITDRATAIKRCRYLAKLELGSALLVTEILPTDKI